MPRTDRVAGRLQVLGEPPGSWGAAGDRNARDGATAASAATGVAARALASQSRRVIPIGRKGSLSFRDVELVGESQARSPRPVRGGELHGAGRADEDLGARVGQVLNESLDHPGAPIGAEGRIVSAVSRKIVIRAAEGSLSDHIRIGMGRVFG